VPNVLTTDTLTYTTPRLAQFIIFNGRQLVPGQRLNGLERAGIAGANLPLVLQLDGIPSGKLAGSYTDTIILTIEPEP